jgi:hypothetical protein
VVKSKNVRDLVEQFVSDLQDVFMADLIQAVAGTKLAKSPLAAVAKGKASRAKGAKRSPGELEKLVEKLHAYVGKHPGQRIEQIALGMGLATKELNLPAKKLIAEKKVSTKGHKRATSYFAK